MQLHDERHARAGRSATSAPMSSPLRGIYTTVSHGTPRMAAVPSRCPCPSHPAVTRPDPAEPVQLCSNTAARIALETPEPVSTRPLRRRHRPRHRPRSGSASICTEADGWDVHRHARLPLFQTGRRDMTSRLLQPRDMFTCKIFFFSWSDAKNSGVELKRLVLNFVLWVPVMLWV